MSSHIEKKKYSFWKGLGKGLLEIGKGAAIIAPFILKQAQEAGVNVSKWIIFGIGVATVVNNYRKNKDNGKHEAPSESHQDDDQTASEGDER